MEVTFRAPVQPNVIDVRLVSFANVEYMLDNAAAFTFVRSMFSNR